MNSSTKQPITRTLIILLLAIVFLLFYLQFVKLEREARLDRLVSEHIGHLELIEYMVESRYHEYYTTLTLMANANEFSHYFAHPSFETQREVEGLFARLAINRSYIKALLFAQSGPCEEYDCYLSLYGTVEETEAFIDLHYCDAIEAEQYEQGMLLSSPLVINDQKEDDSLYSQITLCYPVYQAGKFKGKLIMVVDGNDILNTINHFLTGHPSELGFLLFDSSHANFFYKIAESSITHYGLSVTDAECGLLNATKTQSEGQFTQNGYEYYFIQVAPKKEQIVFLDGGHFATAAFFFVPEEVAHLLDSILLRNKYVRWSLFLFILAIGIVFVLILFSRWDDKRWLQLNNIIFEKSHDGVLILDTECNPLFVNRTYRLMSAFTTRELKSSPHKVYSLLGEEVPAESLVDSDTLVWVNGKRHAILLNVNVLTPPNTYKDHAFFIFLYSNPIKIGDSLIDQALSPDSTLQEIENYPLKLLNAKKRMHEQIVVASLEFTNMNSIESQYSLDEQYLLSSQVRKRIAKTFDQNDIILQYSSNHYLLVLTASPETYSELLAKLTELFVRPFVIRRNRITILCQIGLSSISTSECQRASLLRESRIALASLKDSENNNIAQYTDALDRKMSRKSEILKRIPEALRSEVLEVHFQPIVTLDNDTIISAEALSRWKDPYLGVVTPNEFIPVIEQYGYESLLAEHVIKQACKFLQSVKKGVWVSINLGYNELQNPDLFNLIAENLNTYDLPSNRLRIELTESTLMTDEKEVRKTLGKLRAYGIKIAIDDFGSGYSSLSTLHNLEIDMLKIDRSFIKDYPAADDGVILKAMVRMAQELKILTLIEGIETKEQREFAKSLGVDYYQGFYFSQAIDVAGFNALLDTPKDE